MKTIKAPLIFNANNPIEEEFKDVKEHAEDAIRHMIQAIEKADRKLFALKMDLAERDRTIAELEKQIRDL